MVFVSHFLTHRPSTHPFVWLCSLSLFFHRRPGKCATEKMVELSPNGCRLHRTAHPRSLFSTLHICPAFFSSSFQCFIHLFFHFPFRLGFQMLSTHSQCIHCAMNQSKWIELPPNFSPCLRVSVSAEKKFFIRISVESVSFRILGYAKGCTKSTKQKTNYCAHFIFYTHTKKVNKIEMSSFYWKLTTQQTPNQATNQPKKQTNKNTIFLSFFLLLFFF